MDPVQRIAIVIEPEPLLADLIAEALRRLGYDVATAATHVGGAVLAATYGRVDFGVVAVPAPGEDRSGSYLVEARKANVSMGMVVILSDPEDIANEVPRSAVRIVKPFSFDELKRAVARATSALGDLSG